MGIHYRHTAALLVLLFSLDVYSATRKTVNHAQTARDIVNGQTATTGAISVPAGAVAFYGQDYVDRHEAKSLLTSGNIGSGAANGPGGGIGGNVRTKQAVTIKPAVVIPKSAIANLALNAIKGGVASVAATAAVMWAIDQIPGASFDPQTGELVKSNAPEIVKTGTYWYSSRGGEYRASSALQACRRGQSGTYNVYKNGTTQPLGASDTTAGCHGSFGYLETLYSATFNCPYGVNPSTYVCYPTAQPFPPPEPFTSADDQAFLATLAAVQNSEWLRDLIKASCNGSNNPAGCYESLVERRQLMGPALQLGPKTSTTTTTTSPSGSTSTTTTTSQNTYTYTYGDNYYDYSTTTKTETTKDGQTTTEETTDDQPGEEPQEEPSEDFEGDYQDSEFPEVPSFYEQKYPDGLEGVWQQARADIDQSAFMQFLQGFVPSFSGSCPAFGLGFNIASWANYGTIQFSSICYVLDFVKIILLVTALFTFRKVTFGG